MWHPTRGTEADVQGGTGQLPRRRQQAHGIIHGPGLRGVERGGGDRRDDAREHVCHAPDDGLHRRLPAQWRPPSARRGLQQLASHAVQSQASTPSDTLSCNSVPCKPLRTRSTAGGRNTPHLGRWRYRHLPRHQGRPRRAPEGRRGSRHVAPTSEPRGTPLDP
eukprot:scaffold3815_cov355-Prasinococcus_capsulatus_cf.AAC.8